MKKYSYLLIIIIGICKSSLCIAEFDTVVALTKNLDESGNINRLIEGADGSIYGTSTNGGGEFGGGTIFKISKDGSGYQVLHSFNSSPSDAINPLDNVIEGSDGILYGTTNGGGKNGLGTIFKINKDGSSYKLLYEFSMDSLGFHPIAFLWEASDGLLYGTTSRGGNGPIGSVFKINKDGTNFTNLFLFENAGLGAMRDSSLVEGEDGYLYGTTKHHLFKISKDGNDIKSLHHFSDPPLGGMSGSGPVKGVISNNGTLYGVTKRGGASGFGTVYKIKEDGTDFTLLWGFINSNSFPNKPDYGLVLDTTGTLYGVANNLVYKLNKDGSGFEIVRSSEGKLRNPSSSLMQASDGALYGTVFYGVWCDGIGYGGIYSIRDSVETIFNWAEIEFPQYFPIEEKTQTFGSWLFRYYPLTGIYVGKNNDDNGIYVLGGVFGNSPLFVNSKKAILDQVIGNNAILCE